MCLSPLAIPNVLYIFHFPIMILLLFSLMKRVYCILSVVINRKKKKNFLHLLPTMKLIFTDNCIVLIQCNTTRLTSRTSHVSHLPFEHISHTDCKKYSTKQELTNTYSSVLVVDNQSGLWTSCCIKDQHKSESLHVCVMIL